MAEQEQFQYLKAPRVGKISIPLRGGGKQLLDCVAQLTPDFLLAEFLPDALPVSFIDPEKEFLLFFDTGSFFFSLSATLKEIVEDRKLVLTDPKPSKIQQAQKRDFFRINTLLPINLAPKPLAPETEEEKWPFVGEIINLSGSGVQIRFHPPFTKLEANQQMLLNIPLPIPKLQTITCMGTVMREWVRPDRTYVVGFKFDDLEEKELDKLIAYCLARQRQDLSLKVRILGTSPT